MTSDILSKDEMSKLCDFAFNDCSLGIILSDVNGRIINVNKILSKSTGYSRIELLRMRVSDINSYFSLNSWSKFVLLLKRKKSFTFESVYKRKDGSTYPVEIMSDYINFDGRAFVFSFATDISSRKIIEDELVSIKSSYTDLANNIPGIVYRSLIKSRGNNMLFFNDMLKKVTGYNERELISGTVCSIDPLIIPDDRARVISIVNDAITKHDSFTVEYRLRRKDGRIIWLAEYGRPVYDKNGNVLHLDGVIFDITERKNIEAELKKSEASYRSIFENSPESIVVLDTRGIIVNVNKSVTLLSGYRASEVVGKNLFSLPLFSKEVKKLITQRFAERLSGKAISPYIVEIINKKGVKKLCSIIGSLIRNINGDVINELVIVTDVSNLMGGLK